MIKYLQNHKSKRNFSNIISKNSFADGIVIVNCLSFFSILNALDKSNLSNWIGYSPCFYPVEDIELSEKEITFEKGVKND